MRTFVAVVFVPLALLLLASCATLSEEECRAADWYQIGVNDGAEGRATDYVESHRRACAGLGPAGAGAWNRIVVTVGHFTSGLGGKID